MDFIKTIFQLIGIFYLLWGVFYFIKIVLNFFGKLTSKFFGFDSSIVSRETQVVLNQEEVKDLNRQILLEQVKRYDLGYEQGFREAVCKINNYLKDQNMDLEFDPDSVDQKTIN